MNILTKVNEKNIRKILFIVFLFCLINPLFAEGESELKMGGAGWTQYGIIQKSSDTSLGLDLNGKGMLSSGALFHIGGNVSEKLIINVGIGAVAVHSVLGDSTLDGGYSPMGVYPFVDEANAKIQVMEDETKNLYFKAGLFAFDYTPDANNLGYYLLRGPVYPGVVSSGFETKAHTKKLGIQSHFEVAGLKQDLIVNSEIDLFPLFDFSTAYVVSYGKENLFNVYTGVNFYRWFAIEDTLTNELWVGEDTTYLNPADSSLIQLDTTLLTYAGTKIVIGGSFDIKGLLGEMDLLGPNDLKIYGELAVLGLDDSPVHNRIYGELSERTPYMLGINLPAFNFLDLLSFELEWYKSDFPDDMTRYNPSNSAFPSPLPVENPDFNDKDNFKWSLYGSKVFQNHIKFIFQIANDHYKPGIFKGYGDNNPPSRQSITNESGDWYWMTKLAYFF